MAESRVFTVTFRARNNVEFRTDCRGLAEMVSAVFAASTLINPPALNTIIGSNDDQRVFSLLRHFEERNYSKYEFGGIAVQEIGGP